MHTPATPATPDPPRDIAAGRLVRLAASALLLGSAAAAASPAAVCSARSSAVAPRVIELYTSEGCSSCPPADRWLSTLKGRSDVLALGLHVTYWDRLGWPDRFAQAEFTARQHDWAARHGRRQVYTPQVLVDGQDWRRWPALPAATAVAAPVSVQLSRQGELVMAEVSAAAAGSAAGLAYAGYWAVLEDDHLTRVRAGENAGEALRHDHVVRLLRPLPAWPGAAGQRAQLSVTRGDAATPRRVAFVVTEAATGRPVQAVSLAC